MTLSYVNFQHSVIFIFSPTRFITMKSGDKNFRLIKFWPKYNFYTYDNESTWAKIKPVICEELTWQIAKLARLPDVIKVFVGLNTLNGHLADCQSKVKYIHTILSVLALVTILAIIVRMVEFENKIQSLQKKI